MHLLVYLHGAWLYNIMCCCIMYIPVVVEYNHESLGHNMYYDYEVSFHTYYTKSHSYAIKHRLKLTTKRMHT